MTASLQVNSAGVIVVKNRCCALSLSTGWPAAVWLSPTGSFLHFGKLLRACSCAPLFPSKTPTTLAGLQLATVTTHETQAAARMALFARHHLPQAPAVEVLQASSLPDYANDTLAAAPLRGCPMASYTTSLRVGRQDLDVVVDTGSSELFLMGDPCIGCNVTSNGVYQPGKTATALGIPNHLDYGDGGVFGKIYLDQVSLPNISKPVKLAVTRASVGGMFPFTSCIDPSLGAPVPGVLGLNNLSWGSLAREGLHRVGPDYYMNALILAGMPAVLAAQLCDSGGHLWMGGYNPKHTTAPPTFVPMSYNYVVIKGLSLGNKSLYDGNATWGLVDTGNSLLELPDAGFLTFKRVIAAKLEPYDQVTYNVSDCAPGESRSECEIKCVLGLPDDRADIDKMLPNLTMTLIAEGNSTVTLNMTASRSYMLPYPGPDGNTMWCLSKLKNSGPYLGDIGAPLMRSFVTVFDLANGRLGFAPQQFDKCADPVAPAPHPEPPTPGAPTPGLPGPGCRGIHLWAKLLIVAGIVTGLVIFAAAGIAVAQSRAHLAETPTGQHITGPHGFGGRVLLTLGSFPGAVFSAVKRATAGRAHPPSAEAADGLRLLLPI